MNFLFGQTFVPVSNTIRGTVYTHFVYTVPYIARVAYFNGNSKPTTIRGTVYTHFVYTVPYIARVAFFNGNSKPTTIRGTVYTFCIHRSLYS